jgi:hypothetical protein
MLQAQQLPLRGLPPSPLLRCGIQVYCITSKSLGNLPTTWATADDCAACSDIFTSMVCHTCFVVHQNVSHSWTAL